MVKRTKGGRPGEGKAPIPAAVDLAKLEAEVAEIVSASPPPEPSPTPVRRYTPAEAREQVRRIEELMIDGAREGQIYRLLKGDSQNPGAYPGITRKRVKELAQRIRTDWSSIASDEQRIADREAAIRRIQRMRLVACGVRDPKAPGAWLVPPNHMAVARYEALLMELQGTKDAIKLDVNVHYTQAMLAVVGRLSGEDATDLLDEAMEQARLADMARRELPALTVGERIRTGSVIDVPAEKEGARTP